MALNTKCKFYYGIEITADNNTLDFSEGSGELNVNIPVGIYSPQEIASKLTTLFNAAGSLVYTCSFNRTTRKLTIATTSNFSLLIASGTHAGTSLYNTLGFTGGIDLTGSSSYLAPSSTGYEFVPQFYLLDYVPLENNIRSIQASVNETGSGQVETVRYGSKRFMECSIELITNNKFNSSTFWTSSLTGLDDARNFMNYAIQKSKIEFMPDKDIVSDYYTLILESTEIDQNGLGYKLTEQLEYGSGYYKTGRLIFREIT
jgi:hypothetical protein